MAQIENLNIHEVEGDSFVGFRVHEEKVDLFYPKAYPLYSKSETLVSDILHFLRTFKLTDNYASTLKLSSVSKYGTFLLTSYLWIIQDYLCNGFYINREKEYKKNKGGRINWKRTMQELSLVSNGNIIYSNIIGENKHRTDNLLVEIHKFCVKRSINILGWLFNLSSKNIETRKVTPNLKTYYIHVIESELDITFEDAKKVRLQHMHNVLEGLDEYNEYGDVVYGVNSYHYIFEQLIDEVFGNKDIIKSEFNPSGKWYFSIGKLEGQERSASKLRPDTILIKDGNCYVLDAKYYTFGTAGENGSLPEISSIQKQIVYAEFIDNHREKFNISKSIFNVFLIPYDQKKNPFNLSDPGKLAYVGYAKSDSHENQDSEPKTYELIHTFLIDLKHLILAWEDKSNDSEIDLLVSKIHEIAKNR